MNVNIGDLAIVVGGIAENLGAIVRVVESHPEYSARIDTHVWRVEVTGQPLLCHNHATGVTARRTGLICARDYDLKPVSGLPITDDVSDEVTA